MYVLVDSDADLNAVDFDDDTPPHFAANQSENTEDLK